MNEEQVKPQLTGRNQDGTFIKGISGNPAGKPVGTLTFKTKWEEFVTKVAEQEGKTPKEIDNELFQVGLAKAKEGDYQFYKDLHDRVYGKPVQPTELDVKGNVTINFDNSFNDETI